MFLWLVYHTRAAYHTWVEMITTLYIRPGFFLPPCGGGARWGVNYPLPLIPSRQGRGEKYALARENSPIIQAVGYSLGEGVNTLSP